MKQILKIFLLFLTFTLSNPSSRADITTSLNSPGSTVTVEQPDKLTQRLKPSETSPAAEEASSEIEEGETVEREALPQQMSRGKLVGYRVQVFTDNNARTAKAEARQRERALSARFPTMRAYVAYAAPYWRLRVGDFETREEAQKAMAEISAAFPLYSRELRVVRDRINQ